MSRAYDYVFLTLRRAAAAHRTLAKQLRDGVGPALAAGGGEILGQFAPQLGWAADEAAVLVRWPDAVRRADAGAPLADAVLAGAAIVSQARPEPLRATLRPSDRDVLGAGGVHVHRWFEIGAADEEEFIALSRQGWADFEARFDAAIFGLFRAEPSERDLARGEARLLLVTRYGDHGVWEASRDPATEAMRVFARRQQLTRRTWAASTRLVATP
ncbi:MAG TPA: hypothetical protein VMU93_04840 [Caulobacteraceae bacterium]|nr:hypothetical protein [Caulobacteraceae bacterium]